MQFLDLNRGGQKEMQVILYNLKLKSASLKHEKFSKMISKNLFNIKF